MTASPVPDADATIADPLALLHEALLAASRADALGDRLRALARAAAAIAGGAVTIVVREARMEPQLVVRVRPTGPRTAVDEPVTLVSAAVWRRWLRLFERRADALRAPGASGRLLALDLADPWVRREFGGAIGGIAEPDVRTDVVGALTDGDREEPAGLLVAPLAGVDGGVLATVVVEVRGAWPPAPAVSRAIELVAHQVAQHVAEARLTALADRRAERLQRLQEAGAALARSLDEREVARELAVQLARLVPCDGIVVAHPDLEHGIVRTPLRQVRGLSRPRADQPLGSGPIAEVARTGRLVRVDDYGAAVSPLAAADDVVGDGGPAGSVLAAPMRVGTQLIGVVAVHAAASHAFDGEDEELLRAVAAQAATAIANARQFTESEAERRQTEALADVARAVGSSLRFGDVMRLVLRHTSGLLRAGGAFVALQRDEYLHIVAGVGSASLLAGVHVPVASSMMGRALRTGRHFVSNDVARDEAYDRSLQRVTPLENAVLVPLVGAAGPIGVVAAVNRADDFGEADARVLQRLADHVAVAIVNARLFEDVTTATREWKIAFDAIAAGMVVLDDRALIQRANARAAELTGHAAPESLAGLDLRAVLGVLATSDDDLIERACAGGDPARATIAAADGRRFDVVAAPHPQGGAVVTFDDVTAHHALAERYRLVVETSRDAIVITGLDRRIAFANAAAHELFGRGDALVGTLAADLVTSAYAEEVERRAALARGGAPQRYDVVVRRPDGSERLAAVVTAPLGAPGQATGVVAALRDVTEERAAVDALAVSETRYRRLFESATDAIYTLDARGVCTSANDATSALVGVPNASIVGASSMSFVDPDDREFVRERFEAAVRGAPQRFECRMTGAGGARKLISVTHTPLGRAPDGTAAGVLAVARDVTAERERAAALARSEARYERLVESASDVIFTVDAAGRLTAVNHALEQATGRTRAALLGVDATTLLGEARLGVAALLRGALRGERVRGEARLRDLDGGERIGSVVAAPIHEHGVVTGALAIIRDVTDERRLAEQLVRREKLASVGRLVRGVAHELNNPLTSIATLAELLVTEADPTVLPNDARPPVPLDPASVRDTAATIHREARRAARIVGRLHAFARQRAPERVATDLNRVLLDALEPRRHALRMAAVDLVVTLDYELPTTWADAHQLQQVFVQLLALAEQALAAAAGGRSLTLRTDRVEGVLAATIAHTGAPTPPAVVAAAVEPFALSDAADDATALATSVAAAIVREHEGRIRVDAADAGTAFVVELPLVVPPAGSAPEADAE